MTSLANEGWHLLPSITDLSHSTLLDTDLSRVGDKWLPLDLPSTPTLSGPAILQLKRLKDVSHTKISSENGSPRSMFRLTLFDGHTSCAAMNLSPIPGLSGKSYPGTKVRLRGTVQVLGGFLLLSPETCEVLGGRVERLVENIEKNEGITKRSGESGTDGPPRFVPFGAGKAPALVTVVRETEDGGEEVKEERAEKPRPGKKNQPTGESEERGRRGGSRRDQGSRGTSSRGRHGDQGSSRGGGGSRDSRYDHGGGSIDERGGNYGNREGSRDGNYGNQDGNRGGRSGSYGNQGDRDSSSRGGSSRGGSYERRGNDRSDSRSRGSGKRGGRNEEYGREERGDSERNDDCDRSDRGNRGGRDRNDRGGRGRNERGGKDRYDKGGRGRSNDRGGRDRNDRGGRDRSDRGGSRDRSDRGRRDYDREERRDDDRGRRDDDRDYSRRDNDRGDRGDRDRGGRGDRDRGGRGDRGGRRGRGKYDRYPSTAAPAAPFAASDTDFPALGGGGPPPSSSDAFPGSRDAFPSLGAPGPSSFPTLGLDPAPARLEVDEEGFERHDHLLYDDDSGISAAMGGMGLGESSGYQQSSGRRDQGYNQHRDQRYDQRSNQSYDQRHNERYDRGYEDQFEYDRQSYRSMQQQAGSSGVGYHGNQGGNQGGNHGNQGGNPSGYHSHSYYGKTHMTGGRGRSSSYRR